MRELPGAAVGLAAVAEEEEAAEEDEEADEEDDAEVGLSAGADGAEEKDDAAAAGSVKAEAVPLTLKPSKAFCSSLSKYGSGTERMAGRELIFSNRRRHLADSLETAASLLSEANRQRRMTKLARICTRALGRV